MIDFPLIDKWRYAQPKYEFPDAFDIVEHWPEIQTQLAFEERGY